MVKRTTRYPRDDAISAMPRALTSKMAPIKAGWACGFPIRLATVKKTLETTRNPTGFIKPGSEGSALKNRRGSLRSRVKVPK